MSVEQNLRCQLRLAPDCATPEVMLDCPPYFRAAACCVPCGKAYQQKFPLAAQSITLRPIVALGSAVVL